MTPSPATQSEALNAASARQRLGALLGPRTPIRFETVQRQRLAAGDAFICDEVTFGGASGPIRAFLTGPAGSWHQRPAILYIHAHGHRYAIGGRELIEGRPSLQAPAYGRALADTGFVSLCIDLPCFGLRDGQKEDSLAKSHLWAGRTLFGQMLTELQAAFDWLAGQNGIREDRVGVMGFSMGATLAFWLAALEPRVAAVAHLCCFADLATLIESGAHDLHGHYMTVPGLVGAFRTGDIAGLVAPRPQLICLGAQDPLTPPFAIERALTDVRAHYGADARQLSVVVEEQSGHLETLRMREAVLAHFSASL